jgi:peroxiredoxin Q/BCP
MDDVSTQQKFVSLNSLDYPVLSDTTGEVATLFGVKRRFDILKTKRATFVIGTDRILKGQFVSETNMNAHADWALSLLATL